MSLSYAMISQTTIVALTHLLHRELERCRYFFIWISCIQTQFEREVKEITRLKSSPVEATLFTDRHNLHAH